MSNDTNIKFIKNPKVIDKDWGFEVIIHNDNGYCGKILHFNKNTEFSMHYHVEKHESWIVNFGKFYLITINPVNAEEKVFTLKKGDVVTIPQGQPHQLQALEEGEIFEVSTPDDVKDSYRIWKGVNGN